MRSFAVIAVFALSCFAQKSERAIRTESIHYDLEHSVLSLTVSEGTVDKDGEFEPKKLHDYTVDLRKAAMAKDSEVSLSFSRQEASLMRMFLENVVVAYMIASAQWYESGGDKPEKKTPKDASDRSRAAAAIRSSGLRPNLREHSAGHSR